MNPLLTVDLSPFPPLTTEKIFQAEIDRIYEPHEFGMLHSKEECRQLADEVRAACDRLGLDQCQVEVTSSMRGGVRIYVQHPYGDQLPWPEMTWERFRELFGTGEGVYRQIDRRAENERRLKQEQQAFERRCREEWERRWGRTIL